MLGGKKFLWMPKVTHGSYRASASKLLPNVHRGNRKPPRQVHNRTWSLLVYQIEHIAASFVRDEVELWDHSPVGCRKSRIAASANRQEKQVCTFVYFLLAISFVFLLRLLSLYAKSIRKFFGGVL